MKKGVFCLSIDVELLWGKHFLLSYEKFASLMVKERTLIRELLNLTRKYNFPITWAIVGHLFLNECVRKNNVLHSEIKKPNFSWLSRDWLAKDPATNLKRDPLWYGQDILQEIKNAKNQEIGSHSFSHIPMGDEGCTKEVADSEIKACFNLAKKEKIKLSSFVFPFNSIGHLETLKRYGFISFRGMQPNILFSKGFLHSLVMLIDLFFIDPPVSKPLIEEGLVNIPASMYFCSSRGIRKFIPSGLRFMKAKRGIDKAIKENKVFHLWVHPVDLIDENGRLLKELEKIMDYAFNKRKEGLLEIKTMQDIADKIIN